MWILLLLFGLCVCISAQDKAGECPTISVTGPAGIVPPGELATYTANIEGVDKHANLKYVWSVSKGTIESGQGTLEVKIRISDDQLCPTVTLQIIGLPNDCPSMASETSSCDFAPQAEKIGEFARPVSSISDKKFEMIGNTANNNPNSQIYISVGTDPSAFSKVVGQLAGRVRKYLPEDSRITYINCASSTTIIKVWNVPPGANPPTCNENRSQLEQLLSPTRADAARRFPSCPKISIYGPPGLTMPRGLMTFKSVVSGKVPRKIKYAWEVKPGKIVSGQGTRSIKVRAPTREGISTVRAYLQIRGLAGTCDDRASEVAGIAAQPVVAPYDQYGDISLAEEKGRLQSGAAALEKNPSYRILIIKRVRKIDETVLKRVRDIKLFFRKTLGLSTRQFQIVTKIAPKTGSVIWFVRPGTNITSLIGGN